MAAIIFNTRYDTGRRYRNTIENGIPYAGQDLGSYAPANFDPPAGYKLVAEAGQTITFDKATDVAYGAAGKFAFKKGVVGNITFDDATFGDPLEGKVKAGYAKEVSASGSLTKKYMPYAIGLLLIVGAVMIYKKLKGKK